MQLHAVHPHFVHKAWAEGAHVLAQACDKANDEVTPDQLRMRCARGELTLMRLTDDTGAESLAWVVVRFEDQPNARFLFVYAIHAPGQTAPEAFELLADFARANGATKIRGACQPALVRLWSRKFNFTPSYTIMERAL